MKKIFVIILGCLFLTSAYAMKSAQALKDQEYKEKHLAIMQQALINRHPSEGIDFTSTDMVFVAAVYGEFMILKSIFSCSLAERINLIDPLAGENIFHFIAEAKYLACQDEKRLKEKLSEAKDMINFLISKGLNINAQNEFAQTPLDVLEEKNETEIIKKLKEAFRAKGAKTSKELSQEKK